MNGVCFVFMFLNEMHCFMCCAKKTNGTGTRPWRDVAVALGSKQT